MTGTYVISNEAWYAPTTRGPADVVVIVNDGDSSYELIFEECPDPVYRAIRLILRTGDMAALQAAPQLFRELGQRSVHTLTHLVQILDQLGFTDVTPRGR